MRSNGLLVHEATIFEAWNRVAVALLVPGVESIHGCQVRVNEGPGCATPGNTLASLNGFLEARGKHGTVATAKAIFPFLRRQNRNHAEAMRVFSRMRTAFATKPSKMRQSYFARMIDVHVAGTDQVGRLIDVINAGNHRGSALVLTPWDPTKDLNMQRQRGFPCLNTIHVNVFGSELHVCGIYPLQYALPKLYGNLLGLRALGLHLSHNTRTQLVSFSCYATVERIGSGFTKQHLLSLAGQVS